MPVVVQRKALLTGATGFIGGHLVRGLLATGWELHLVVLPDAGLGTVADLAASVHIYPHGGSTEQLVKIMSEVRPDVVFHLASLFLVQHQPEEIQQLIASNLVFATQIVEAMTQTGCSCLVNTGTSWEHFENSGYNPVNLYAATKQAYEVLLEYYLVTTDIRVVTLKLFDTYGPDDHRPKLFTLLQKVAASCETIAMSPGEQLIDIVYIDDVVSAFMLAADRLLAGIANGHERYAVTSGNPVRLKDLVELFVTVTGSKMPIEWGGRNYRAREVMVPWNSGTTLPGWLPRVGLQEGIRRICGPSQEQEA